MTMRRQIKVLLVEDMVEDAEMLLREMRVKGLEIGRASCRERVFALV